MKTLKGLLLASCLSFMPMQPAVGGTLILLVDVSISITPEDTELQMQAYSNAMMNVYGLEYVDIEVIAFGARAKSMHFGDNRRAAAAFKSFDRGFVDNTATCIEEALYILKERLPIYEEPIVIDISGDGETNCKAKDVVHKLLDDIAGNDIRVNSLFVKGNMSGKIYPNFNSEEGFLNFYESLQRNGGFTLIAESFGHFQESLERKLAIEIAGIIPENNQIEVAANVD